MLKKPVVLMHLSQTVQDIGIHYLSRLSQLHPLGTFKTRVKDHLTI